MQHIWKTIRGYIWWTADRGSLHYDVMVSLILLFVFVAPRYINFKDKPTERNPHPIGVVVNSDGQGGLFYQVDATAVGEKTGDALDDALLKIIEPISGEVKIVDKKQLKDHTGKVIAYQVRAQR